MLATLIIKDLAIIERLEVTLENGFTVFTGETGAGKSIVVEALKLLNGGRATAELIRGSCERAVVEGELLLSHEERTRLDPHLSNLGIEHGEELVVRRVLTRSGRNKVVINGSLATVATLRELMSHLLDITGQREHYSLLDVSRHVNMLDHFGRLQSMASGVAKGYREICRMREVLSQLREEARTRLSRLDYVRFQLSELDELGVHPGEEQELDAEAMRLANAERLRELRFRGLELLYEGDGAVVEMIAQLAEELRRGANRLPEFAAISSSIEQAVSLLEDAVHDLRRLDEIDADPQRLDQIHERLSQLSLVRRKYGCTVDELVVQAERLREDAERLERADEDLERHEKETTEATERVLCSAQELSRKRRDVVGDLTTSIQKELTHLGMPGATFAVNLHPQQGAENLRQTGLDEVEFAFSANRGEEVKPLARIASGGELSRVLLALKKVFSDSDEVSTYVFDEVDAGIGGTTAECVATTLCDVGADHQVLCVTHLATIACHADHHVAVSKRTEHDRTVSEPRLLDHDEERVEELARMLGGPGVTEQSRSHAREMLSLARTRTPHQVRCT